MIFASSSSMSSNVVMAVMMIALFGVMYFLMIRPQNKERQRVQQMQSAIEVGDAVVTSGGFYGIVIDVAEEDVVVEFGSNKNCRIPMRKEAIAQVEKPGDALENKEEKK